MEKKVIEEHNKESQAFWEKKAALYSKFISVENIPIMAALSSLSKVSTSKSILEVGCGSGEGTKYLTLQSQSPSIIYGLDFSETMISLSMENFKNFENFNSNTKNSYEKITNDSAKSRIIVPNHIEKGTHIKLIQGDCENLPFEEEQFDSYVSSLCLHLTKDYPKALREAYRVLKKGGHFSLAIWGKRSLTNLRMIEDICDQFGLEVKMLKNYKMGEDEKKLILTCEEIGFQKVRVSYSNIIRNIESKEVYYMKFFDESLKLQIEEIKKKNPEKAKEIELAIEKKVTTFFDVEKNVPVMNILYLFGQK